MLYRALTLGLGVVLIIFSGFYFLEQEILIWAKPFLGVVKVYWAKFLALSFSDLWYGFIPFARRFVFFELPKKMIGPLLLVGILSRHSRRKFIAFIAWIEIKARGFQGGVVNRFGSFIGNRTSFIVSTALSCLVFTVVLFFFGKYLLFWFSSIGFFKFLATLPRMFWGGFIGRILQRVLFRIVAFLYLNKLGMFLYRFFPDDLRSKIRARKLGIIRRTIRRKRMTKAKLREMKHQPLERLRLMWQIWTEIRLRATRRNDRT